MQIIKRLKLLFINKELVDFTIECNEQYNKINEYCKKNGSETYENILTTIRVLKNQREVEDSKSIKKDKWYFDRCVDTALKILIMTR